MHLQNLMLGFLNFKEKFHHHTTDDEISLLRNTQLFEKLNASTFQKLLHSVETIRFADHTQLNLQDSEDPLYIISQGSVRLFIYDRLGKKSILASFIKGQYFGSNSLIGKFNPTHPIFVETLGATSLIKVPPEFIAQALKSDPQIKHTLIKSAYKQSINTLVCALGFYSEFKILIETAEEQGYIFELDDGEVLFKEGDKPDFAYFIIDGEIELQLRSKNTHEINPVRLHEGSLFGELSIITGKPRATSAVMRSKTHLLAIPAATFKQYFLNSPLLQRIIRKLQQTYQLPIHGPVEQFIGHIPKMGTTLTSFSKAASDSVLLSELSLDYDLFTFCITNLIGEKCYRYQKDCENMRELYVLNDAIVGIKVQGTWDSLSAICQLLLEQVKIAPAWLNDFQATGEIPDLESLLA